MISTLSKQGGRRYPKMGSTSFIFSGAFPSVGETVVLTSHIGTLKHGGDDAPYEFIKSSSKRSEKQSRFELNRQKKLILRNDIERAWTDVTGESSPVEIKELALEIVPVSIPKPVEWILKDHDRVKALLALWNRQIEEQDDEEILMLLM